MAGLGLVKKVKEDITVEKLQKLFPKKKNTITQETVDIINRYQNDPEFDGVKLVDTLTTFQGVMYKNSSSIQEYIDAVRFCAFLESEGDNYTEAYKKAFSYRESVQSRLDSETGSQEHRELTHMASRYRKSPIVIDILTQADVPLHLMFQGARYEAVNILINKARNSKFDKDQIAAAKAILENVKPPDNMKIELDVGIKENSAVQQLNEQLAEIAASSLKHLEHGTTDLGKLGGMKPKDEFEDAEVVE